MSNFSRLLPIAMVLASLAGAAAAQSSCSSDGQPRPVGLLERFINADCASCWSDARTPGPRPGELALDWIVPGSQGDDAPLSAAATRDALARLQALGQGVPARSRVTKNRVPGAVRELRVAQGLPFNGYIGTSIEMKPGNGGPWQAWLLLVETVPAGSEGTPLARNVVRNAVRPAWDGAKPLSKEEQLRLFESRPMSIPEGADPSRLSVVGWVEDARGRIKAIAQARCLKAPSKG